MNSINNFKLAKKEQTFFFLLYFLSRNINAACPDL